VKLLLLQPPIQDFYHTEIRLQPLGLCSLKAAVEERLPGVRVVVRDYHQGWGRRAVALPPELRYLREFYRAPDRSPFCTFYEYWHFGASFEELAEDVAREAPDVVGISALFTPYYREVLTSAEAIRARRDVPIIVGGHHASAAPLTLLASPGVDFVVRGEGERPLVELLSALEGARPLEEVPNLGFKREGVPFLTEFQENYPLRELPWPDFSDLGPARYRLGREPLYMLAASRGCPHHCSFCSVHTTFGRFQRRSAEAVVGELRRRYDEGYRVFDFEDDNLTFPRREAEELFVRLPDAFPRGGPRFVAMNGLSYLALDRELLRRMKQAGFEEVNLSLVSADPGSREAVGRPHGAGKYREVVGAAASLGLRVVSYQILGLPGESLDAMLTTLCWNARLPVLVGASPFYLAPGSPLARRTGEPTPEECVRARLTALGVDGDSSSRRDVYTLFVATRIVDFLKGLRLEAKRVSLAGALRAARDSGGRAALGAEALERLLAEGRLYAFPRGAAPEPLPMFRLELFHRFWSRLRWVTTRCGQRIELPAVSVPPLRE
jgi:radical SAM superfamily enzyme YgiQ (UPF0313 family)